MRKEVFTYIDDHFDRFIEELRTVCRQPSISAQNIGLRECAGIVAEKLKSIGLEVHVWETEGQPAIYAHMKGEGEQHLLFYNHYDVQPPEPIDAWRYEPFGALIDDGRLYGRGAADNKGPLYSRIHAVESWLKTHGSLPVSVTFLVDGEEEIGSPNLEPCIQAHRRELTADLCIWENAYRDIHGRPEVRLGNKGVLSMELHAETSQVDFHSSYAAVVPSAPWRLVQALSTLKDEKDRILIEGFYDDVEPIGPEEFREMQNTPSVEEELKIRSGLGSLVNGITGFEVNRRLFVEPTCNISGLSGGYTGTGGKTVLPGKAMAGIDMRLVLRQDPKKILGLFRKHLDKHGFSDIEIRPEQGGHAVRPAKTPVTTPYLGLLKQAVALVTDKPLRVFTTSPGTGPRHLFGRWTDMPILSSGTGNAHSRAHAPDENITLNDYREETKIMAALMMILKGFQPPGDH